jgi:uncharacterized protein (DUF1015 family)
MASIRPFTGLRFSIEAGPVEKLTAPPYDVLSPTERDEYAARDAHNVVHLTLPEQKSDDRSKFIKYARSSALLSEWRQDGTLQKEPKPAFYRYTQHFHLPGVSDAFSRTAVIALIKVEPYEAGIVLPHEQTFPKHKEDRMRILEATRAHLECIFGLYEDAESDVLNAIIEAPAGAVTRVRSDEGVDHELEAITDSAATSRLVDLLADRKVWIADGHHRYETALAFRQNLGPKDHLIPEDFMMMALCSISDPGLVLLPTHRILKSLKLSQEEVLEKLSEVFELTPTPSVELMATIEKSHAEGIRAFGMTFPGGVGYVLTEKTKGTLIALNDSEESVALKELDVTVLHRVIFEKLLGIVGLDQIAYTRDDKEAISAPESGAAVSFLMNPPSVADMQEIAQGSEKMPQKSTYYYPKILSGLVIWSLNDF